jgi:hypothetical protein
MFGSTALRHVRDYQQTFTNPPREFKEWERRNIKDTIVVQPINPTPAAAATTTMQYRQLFPKISYHLRPFRDSQVQGEGVGTTEIAEHVAEYLGYT